MKLANSLSTATTPPIILTSPHQQRGDRVGAMLDDEELAQELLFEWSVSPTENLLVVAARAGAWAMEDFATDALARTSFITGFVAAVMATGGWPRLDRAQKDAGAAVLATLAGQE
jgi:hypothetical protein